MKQITYQVTLAVDGNHSVSVQSEDPAAVTESFLLKLLSLSGFHPALTACAVCGSADVRLWSAGLGGAVCPSDADHEAAAGDRLALEGAGDQPVGGVL